jgi:predicted ATPase
MTDVDVAITDDEQERAIAIVDALYARGVKLILKNVPGRKYLKVALARPRRYHFKHSRSRTAASSCGDELSGPEGDSGCPDRGSFWRVTLPGPY